MTQKSLYTIPVPFSSSLFQKILSLFSERFPRVDFLTDRVMFVYDKSTKTELLYANIATFYLTTLLKKFDGNELTGILCLYIVPKVPYTVQSVFIDTPYGNMPFITSGEFALGMFGAPKEPGILINYANDQTTDPRDLLQPYGVTFTVTAPIMDVPTAADYNRYLKANYIPETYETYKLPE